MSEIKPAKKSHSSWVGMRDISFDEYKNAPGLNFHGMKEYYRSPKHYVVYKEDAANQVETPSMKMGRLFHTAVLESDKFLSECIEGPDCAKTTKKWKDFVADHPGKEVIKPKERDQIIGMANAITSDKWASKMLGRGESERSLFARDPDTGILMKGRLDFISGVMNGIVDLKTCQDARPNAFQRSIRTYLYHCQAAYYLKLANLLGMKKECFVFIAVEQQPPHGLKTYEIGRDSLITGENWVEAGLRSFAKTVANKAWLGYPNEQVDVIDLDPWDLLPELVE